MVLPLVRLLYGSGRLLAKPLSGEVRISEFMASNDSTLTDEDGDYSDWIEIHNGQDTDVDLSGWYLTDNTDNLTKWQFPTMTLAVDRYLLVFASNKNRVTSPSELGASDGGAAAQLHTNFKLRSSGEYLALVQPDGATIAWEYTPPGKSRTPRNLLIATLPPTVWKGSKERAEVGSPSILFGWGQAAVCDLFRLAFKRSVKLFMGAGLASYANPPLTRRSMHSEYVPFREKSSLS